jgi:hypothetical protein
MYEVLEPGEKKAGSPTRRANDCWGPGSVRSDETRRTEQHLLHTCMMMMLSAGKYFVPSNNPENECLSQPGD